MRRLIRKGERSIAFLLAFLMAFSSPLSVWAENGPEGADEITPIFSDGSSPNEDLQYTFSEEVSEDGVSSNVKLEVTEKEGNTLTEVILPDGSSVYPEATEDKDGFKQNVDGEEKNIVNYTVNENGKIAFKLKYSSQTVNETESTETPVSETRENNEAEGETKLTPDAETERITEQTQDAETETQENSEVAPVTETEITSEAIPATDTEETNSEQGFIGKAVDFLFPPLEVHAAELDAQLEEKELNVEYEVTRLNQKFSLGKSTRSDTKVTVRTFEELKNAINNANDNDIIQVEGTIECSEVIKIENKKLTIKGILKETVYQNSFLNLDNSEIIFEDAVLDGNSNYRALTATNSVIRLIGSTQIINCKNVGDGGAIHATDTQIFIEDNVIIARNETSPTSIVGGGGAIYATGNSYIEMNGGAIQDNKQNPRRYAGAGGAIYLHGNSKFVMNGGMIKNNNGFFAGAIEMNGYSLVELYSGVISGNTSKEDGGAIYNESEEENALLISGDIQIINNHAGLDGGGIYQATQLDLQGGIIKDNEAEGKGGGIYYVGDEFGDSFVNSIKISNNPLVVGNKVNGQENNLYLPSIRKVLLTGNVTGKIGFTTENAPSFSLPKDDISIDIIINGGENPIKSDTESFDSSLAHFTSDNLSYITRLKEDGENHKVVLSFPIIELNPTSGTLNQLMEFMIRGNTEIPKPIDPVLEDHEFKGWYTTFDYQTGTEYTFSNGAIRQDMMLYAKWYPDVYALDFHSNGGTGTMDAIYHDGKTPTDLPANTFTKEDYEFAGWNTEADGSGTPVADKQAAYEPGKKNTVLYAQWKKITYTVKYDTNGGTPVTIADKTGLDFDSADLLSADVLTREGFTFTGWKVKGEEKAVTDTSKYSDLVKDKTVREVTLQAQWSENTYTVKYDTNGGTPTAITDKTNVKFKDNGLLPADDPTRPGYTFEGWEVDGNKVIDTTAYNTLVANDTVKSVTLVAKWEAKEYTVKYDSNGGTPTGIADKEHVKFWDADLLPAETMTKPGYTFGGWNYNTVPVSDTMKYSDLAADDTVKEITLTAQWVPKQYKVNYDVNGGKPDNYPSETIGFEAVVPIPGAAPTKDGYDFKGWLKDTTKIDGTSVTYDSLVADDTVSEITLVAQWAEKAYTVKFELKPGERGGTLAGDTADQSVKYNQHAAAGADVSVSVDSAFLGWSYSYTPVGSTTPISGTVMDYTTVPILNDVTFIANFAKVPFVSGISTNGFVSVQKGGAPADAGTDTITKIEYDLTDPLPAEAGFKFEGVLHYHIDEIKFNDLYKHEFTLDLNSTEKQEFAVGEDGFTSKIQITVDKANGTVKITGIEESLQFNFAFAEDTKYSVSFKEEKDSADNWGQNTDLYTGDAMGKEPAANPVKPGYTFDGWSSDGSNTPDKMYDPDALVTDKDEVYYAVWTPKEYTVHYNTDGGTAVPDKTGVHYTDTGLTPADNPTKPGYTFAGWEKGIVKITADTAYNTLVADDTVMEVTLTAKWQIKNFTASWVTKDGEALGSIDGGNQTEEGIAYNGNATKDVTAVPASNDSEFIGWEYSYIPDGSTTPVTGFTNDYKTIPILGDITFTAKFASKPFVSIGATNGKVTAAKGTAPEEISGSSGATALIQYTAAEDIENNKGKAALKYAADMHHHLDTISFKDMEGHEYTIWTKEGGGTTAGEDYEVGGKTPATKVTVVMDEKNGTIQLSNIDTSLAFTVVFKEDPKYKAEFFREKDDPASLVQTNDGLYTGNPVGAKPETDPAKPGYKFLGWSTDGTNDPDKMYDKDTLIADKDIVYYGVWELIDYKLTISKTVDGEHGNKKQDFHFTITLKDKDGTPLSGTYSYTGEAIAGVGKPVDGTVTLDADGKAEVTLKHGQSILLDGLHIGEQYTVEETEANQNGYVTTATGDRNPNVTGDLAAAFTNTRTTAPPTGIGPMGHMPTLILGVVFLILTGAGFVWARRRRRA